MTKKESKYNKNPNHNMSIYVYFLGLLFVCAMVPILWMIPFDYASAEDMGFAENVHKAVANGSSFFDVIGVAVNKALELYRVWEGSWVSDFLNQFEPSVFRERAYSIVPVFAVSLICISHFVLLKVILRDLFEISNDVFLAIYFIYSIFFFQFMPSPKYGMYFYIGMVRYTLPVMLAYVITHFLIKYYLNGKKLNLIISLLLGIIVGGCGYPPAILMLTLYIMIAACFFLSAQRKKIFGLLVPFVPFCISLIISVLAPGNQMRGGGNLHAGIKEIGIVLMRSVISGVSGSFYDTNFYTYIRPLFILILLVVILSFYSYDPKSNLINTQKMVAVSICCVLLISCVYSPQELVNLEAAEANSATGFSSGVHNTYYFTFMLFTTLLSFCFGAWLKMLIAKRFTDSRLLDKQWFESRIMRGMAVFSLLFCVSFGRHLIGNTVDYICINFISSGRLSDYDYQMRERIAILKNEDVKNAVVPQMNWDQGPLMHFTLSDEDPKAWANTCVARFYEKESVLAMDRVEYYAQYGYVLETK